MSKSDWIINMDRMRISGSEPSSVILSQKVFSTVTTGPWKCAKISWSQTPRDGVSKPTRQITISTRKMLMLSNTNQLKSTVELGYMSTSVDSLVHQQWHQVVNMRLLRYTHLNRIELTTPVRARGSRECLLRIPSLLEADNCGGVSESP